MRHAAWADGTVAALDESTLTLRLDSGEEKTLALEAVQERGLLRVMATVEDSGEEE